MFSDVLGHMSEMGNTFEGRLLEHISSCPSIFLGHQKLNWRVLSHENRFLGWPMQFFDSPWCRQACTIKGAFVLWVLGLVAHILLQSLLHIRSYLPHADPPQSWIPGSSPRHRTRLRRSWRASNPYCIHGQIWITQGGPESHTSSMNCFGPSKAPVPREKFHYQSIIPFFLSCSFFSSDHTRGLFSEFCRCFSAFHSLLFF